MPPCVLCLLLALACAHSLAADVLVQAESAGTSGVRGNPGWGFLDPADEVADVAGIDASPNPGFPNEPGRFAFDFSSLPAGPYVLWARMARWGGTVETTPIPAATFADSRGHELRFTFPSDDTALGRHFPMHPGGMVGPEGEWTWLRLFDTGELGGEYTLTVTGDPGAGGSGNYKGIWVDAFYFDADGDDAMPPLPEDVSLPGKWEAGPCLSPGSPLKGGLSITYPGRNGAARAGVRRTFAQPAAFAADDCFALWVQCAVPTEALPLTLRDAAGVALHADACDLAGDRPLRAGIWYCLLWPVRAPAGDAFDVTQVASLELGAPLTSAPVQDGAVTVHHPRVATAVQVRDELARARDRLIPAAADSLGLTLRVLDFPRSTVGADKKVILWARGGWGGMPSPQAIRDRIAALRESGADGVVLTVNPIVDGKELYFADQLMSPRRFREEDFAANVAALQQVQWGPLDHSLLRLNVMPGTVDWFDPEWSAVVEKARIAARICRLGRLAGIMFDVEQYDWPTGVFRYEIRPQRGAKTLADYAAQARLRGREMAAAMATEMPGIDVLTTFAGSISGGGGELLVPFLEGMASAPGCHVFDGCEPAYPYRTFRRFLGATDAMRSTSGAIGTGFGLWLDHRLAPFSMDKPEGNYFSPDAVAHALHYALRLSDKYVWLYCEGPLSYWPDATPPAYYDAIKRAREAQDPAWVPPLGGR